MSSRRTSSIRRRFPTTVGRRCRERVAEGRGNRLTPGRRADPANGSGDRTGVEKMTVARRFPVGIAAAAVSNGRQFPAESVAARCRSPAGRAVAVGSRKDDRPQVSCRPRCRSIQTVAADTVSTVIRQGHGAQTGNELRPRRWDDAQRRTEPLENGSRIRAAGGRDVFCTATIEQAFQQPFGVAAKGRVFADAFLGDPQAVHDGRVVAVAEGRADPQQALGCQFS
jgi:hypothetical protein